jgi:hypothetical protein
VLGDVPLEQRCRCREGGEAQPGGRASFLRRLFG